MNNYQWMLQMDGADRKAWFDAEHVENKERALDGDTAAQDGDSREQLEADIKKYRWEHSETSGRVTEWLDRQAAITAEETSDAWEEYRDATQREIAELTAERDELKGQVFTLKCECDDLENELHELTAERDKLQEQLLIGWECECRLQAERERYRSKFGKCLDYADAIHALMDDEGMA